MHQKSGGVLSGSYAITSDQNFQRFCSNFLATEEQGFDRSMLLTNEEGIDWVNRAGTAWPTTIGAPAARQIGDGRRDRRADRQDEADLGHGAAQPREQRRHPRLRQARRALGRRLASSATRRSRSSTRTSPTTPTRSGTTRATCGRSSPTASTDYFDFGVRLEHERDGQVREGAEGHRNRTEAGRHRPDGGRHAATRRRRTTGRGRRDARTGLGIDGPQWVLEHWGDTQPQRSSSSCASRTSRTTGDRACRTSSTSSTAAAAPRTGASGSAVTAAEPLDERPRLEARARQERPDEGDVLLDPDRG